VFSFFFPCLAPDLGGEASDDLALWVSQGLGGTIEIGVEVIQVRGQFGAVGFGQRPPMAFAALGGGDDVSLIFFKPFSRRLIFSYLFGTMLLSR